MKRSLNFCFILLSVLSAFSCVHHEEDPAVFNLIPQPLVCKSTGGEFIFQEGQQIYADEEFLSAVEYVKEQLPEAWLYPTDVEEEAEVALVKDHTMEKDAYSLWVDASGIQIYAGGYEGAVSAVSTVRQLLEGKALSADPAAEKEYVVPAVQIEDAPRFEWRGVHLDVSRHFYRVDEVKELLDLMALYKMNKFHWHLTDDQGWRIEIRHYPLLTEQGAWRKLNNQDLECRARAAAEHNSDFELPQDRILLEDGEEVYGGYYTQEQIREIVSYAAVRGIEVIPEIDMPGHFMAAIDQYPWLTCAGYKGWGKYFTSPLCVGNEQALEFCKNVWEEVFGLFPSTYVHIGADEVDKRNWKKCPLCLSKIKAEGLEDAEALQAWFVREMEAFFLSHGKRMMGWDEVLEDGLSDQTVISWWRAWNQDAVTKATAAGKNVVMCPNSYLYFDYPQGPGNVSDIYNREPMPEGLTPEQEKRVLGIQCNIWTEIIPTVERMLYMLFPRLFAVSEQAWRPSGSPLDWPSFEKKVMNHLHRLDARSVNYRIPDLLGFCEDNIYVDSTALDIRCPYDGVLIRYTEDGTLPDSLSPIYEGPIPVTSDKDFNIRAFRADGTPCQCYRASFRKEDYREATAVEGELRQGLQGNWYEYKGDKAADIVNAPHKLAFIAEEIAIPENVRGLIGLTFDGYLDIPEDGVYTFSINSDDGSVLTIDGEVIIDNDGYHSPVEKVGQAALRKGLHPIHLSYFDPNGGLLEFRLVVDGVKKVCPSEWLKY